MTMRFPGGLAKAVTLSYDDGVFEDIRLVDIMKGKGLKGTFNINGGLFGKQAASEHRQRLSRSFDWRTSTGLRLRWLNNARVK